jgi:hypothetical protein
MIYPLTPQGVCQIKDKTIVSQQQLPTAINSAAPGEEYIVRTYTFRQVAEQFASQAGRDDIKFVVKKKENK